MSRQKTNLLHKSVKPFAQANNQKSNIQLLNTFIPLIALWVAGYLTYNISIWLAVASAVLASGFIVRTFIIFHDCTHGSFYQNKKKNNFLGTLTGVLTLFPYEKWKREHAIHHASSSNLDKRGIGDIWVLTIEEYRAASALTRLKYRLYRQPLIMFGLGPLYLILVANRFNDRDAKPKEKRNTRLINLLIVAYLSLLVVTLGALPVLIVHGISLYIAATLGIWLFYIQHTFEDSYFEEASEWSYVKAAVDGSSYYELPKIFQWLSGNIGYHHVHHLAPRIPNYHLEAAHVTTPPLQYVTKITILESLDSLRYKLYDPDNKRFVTFRKAKQMKLHPKPFAQVTQQKLQTK